MACTMQVQKAYKIRFSKFSVDLLTWNRIRIQTKSKSHIIINLLMQIFHLNLFFAGQDFSTPYMADDLDLFDVPMFTNGSYHL